MKDNESHAHQIDIMNKIALYELMHSCISPDNQKKNDKSKKKLN